MKTGEYLETINVAGTALRRPGPEGLGSLAVQTPEVCFIKSHCTLSVNQELEATTGPPSDEGWLWFMCLTEDGVGSYCSL